MIERIKRVALFIVFIVIFVVAVKLGGWSPLNLFFGPQYEVEKKHKPNAISLWWIAEYPSFISAVENAPKQILTTSYRTGPNGREKVDLSLKRDSRWGLILEVKAPKETLVTIDPKTGEMATTENIPTVTIRDHDLDAIPDSFKIEASGRPLYKESFTQDGYTKYTRSQEHKAILTYWTIGIGYSINHFLYGVDSAMPRR